MEARHGPALSERERQALTGIEESLRADETLERQLRTMRPRHLLGLRWRRRRDTGGRPGAGGSGGT
ncbi:hypothetical protein [Streptacidiphilus neutrinimicus]|uniref:hypothetical protein n=1 Tax=Streptacidiphilus neutrinimicus TaxID=105420 RepID=UPI0005A79A3C|nr:hypothetical protein [Streptacidiphilus neutrinimicus]